MIVFVIFSFLLLAILVFDNYFTRQNLRNVMENQMRIFRYIEVLVAGSTNPIVKSIFLELVKIPTEKLTDINMQEYFSNESFKMLEQIKANLKSHMNKEISDPLEKARGDRVLSELDNMTNLLGTLGKDSSPEYVKQVIDEIMVTMKNIENIREE